MSTNVGVSLASCTGPSGLPFKVTCTNTAKLGVTGNTASGVTPGALSNISCVVTFTTIGCSANVAGSGIGSYNNTGVLTVQAPAGQALTVSGSGCPAVIPNGSAVFGAPGGTSTTVTNLAYTANPKPTITASGF